jgi:hypothetical protein
MGGKRRLWLMSVGLAFEPPDNGRSDYGVTNGFAVTPSGRCEFCALPDHLAAHDVQHRDSARGQYVAACDRALFIDQQQKLGGPALTVFNGIRWVIVCRKD